MNRIAILAGLSLSLALPAGLAAQVVQNPPPSAHTYNHAEIGAFADYLRFTPGHATDNFVGVGGRVGINIIPNIALEAEMSYDFARNYTTTYSGSNSGGINTNFVTTGVRPITALFGPKFQLGTSGPVRAFATGKIGFVDFSFSNPNNVSGSTFSNAVSGIGGSGTHVAFYPGGGVEFFGGPIGVRAEVGDEIYLNNGTHNNLRATIGPTFRF